MVQPGVDGVHVREGAVCRAAGAVDVALQPLVLAEEGPQDDVLVGVGDGAGGADDGLVHTVRVRIADLGEGDVLAVGGGDAVDGPAGDRVAHRDAVAGQGDIEVGGPVGLLSPAAPVVGVLLGGDGHLGADAVVVHLQEALEDGDGGLKVAGAGDVPVPDVLQTSGQGLAAGVPGLAHLGVVGGPDLLPHSGGGGGALLQGGEDVVGVLAVDPGHVRDRLIEAQAAHGLIADLVVDPLVELGAARVVAEHIVEGKAGGHQHQQEVGR